MRRSSIKSRLNNSKRTLTASVTCNAVGQSLQTIILIRKSLLFKGIPEDYFLYY